MKIYDSREPPTVDQPPETLDLRNAALKKSPVDVDPLPVVPCVVNVAVGIETRNGFETKRLQPTGVVLI